MGDDTRAGLERQVDELLCAPPVVPADISAFSSNTLFGQPGIYPDGPEMVPASGAPLDESAALEVIDRCLDPDHAEAARTAFGNGDTARRVPEPALRAALVLLTGGPAAPVLDAFVAGATPVQQLDIGPTEGRGRVVGQERDDPDPARRVLDERYRAEHPAVVAPSLAHALCHHGPLAGNAEEATLHGLLAAVHTWLLATTPTLGALRSELARRQASLTITLLNARAPGSPRASIRCPEGPGAIPGGNPALQGPDLWSIPFTDRPLEQCDLHVPEPVRRSIARLAASSAPPVPSTYDDGLGTWLTEHMGDGPWFGPLVRASAGSALGLFGSR